MMKRIATIFVCGLLTLPMAVMADDKTDPMAQEMCELALNTHLFEDGGAGAEGASVTTREGCKTQTRSREYWVCVLDNMWGGMMLGPAEKGCREREARSKSD